MNLSSMLRSLFLSLATLQASQAVAHVHAGVITLAQSTASERKSDAPKVPKTNTTAEKAAPKKAGNNQDEDDDPPTRVWRAKSWASVMLTLAPGIILFDKAGIEADFIPIRFLSIGVEAITSEQKLGFNSISFGSFRETVLTLNARIYPFTNSFNLLAGYGQRYYTLELGSSADNLLVNGWGATLGKNANIEVENEIVEFGFGNRWQQKKTLTLGIDWLTLYIPTGSGRESAPLLDLVSSESDKKRLRDITKSLRRMTTFSIFKLQLGFSF